MNTPTTLTVYFRVPLPLLVDGGRTRWRVFESRHDKGGKHFAIVAQRVDGKERITLAELRTRGNDRRHYLPTSGVQVRRGTVESRLLSKLVREGRAAVVEPDGDAPF